MKTFKQKILKNMGFYKISLVVIFILVMLVKEIGQLEKNFGEKKLNTTEKEKLPTKTQNV